MYQPIVLEHFCNPRNVGEIPEPDGFGKAKSTTCEDLITLEIKVRDGRLVDVKYRAFGCAAAIACSSFLSERVMGLPLQDALALNPAQIMEALGLPEAKRHAAEMVIEALRAAVQSYQSRGVGAEALAAD